MRQYLCKLFIILQFFVVSAESFEIAGRAFDLEADHVVFDQVTGNIEASRNVSIQINEYYIQAESFRYDAQTVSITLSQDVRVRFRDVELSVDELQYTVLSDSGVAYNVSFQVDDLYVTADKAELKNDTIYFLNILYTKCSLEDGQHYEFSSDELSYQRLTSLLVSKENSFHFYGFRFFKYPLFTRYLSRDSEESIISIFPSFGKTRSEGSYIKFGIPYFINSTSLGKYRLETSEKRGLMLGASHNQILTDFQELKLRAFYFPNEPVVNFGVDYLYFFSDRQLDDPVKKFFSSTNESSEDSFFKFSYQEFMIQNDTIVSKRPELGLRTTYSLFDAIHQLDLSTGSYDESDTQAFRHAIDLQSSYLLFKNTDISFGVGHDLSAYYYRYRDFQNTFLSDWKNKLENSWKRGILRLFLVFNQGILKEFGYNHLYYTNGLSIFDFDSFNQVEVSELYTKLEFPIQNFRFILTSYYQVELETFRSIRLESLYRIHCWDLQFITDFSRKYVSLGFSF